MLCSYRRRALFAAVLPYRSAVVPYRSAPVVRSPWPPRVSFQGFYSSLRANFPKASLLDRRLEVTFDAATNRRRPRPRPRRRRPRARSDRANARRKQRSSSRPSPKTRPRGWPSKGSRAASATPRARRRISCAGTSRSPAIPQRPGPRRGPGATERAIIEAKKRPPRTSAATCRRGAAAPAASRRRWPSRRRGSCRAGTPRRARPAPRLPAGASCGCR